MVQLEGGYFIGQNKTEKNVDVGALGTNLDKQLGGFLSNSVFGKKTKSFLDTKVKDFTESAVRSTTKILHPIKGADVQRIYSNIVDAFETHYWSGANLTDVSISADTIKVNDWDDIDLVADKKVNKNSSLYFQTQDEIVSLSVTFGNAIETQGAEAVFVDGVKQYGKILGGAIIGGPIGLGIIGVTAKNAVMENWMPGALYVMELQPKEIDVDASTARRYESLVEALGSF